ncbi:3209_t:CDS:2, partial [Funneliformis geosporum]
MIRTLTRLNRIPIYPDEKEFEEKDFEKFGEIAGNKLWQSYEHLKANQNQLQNLHKKKAPEENNKTTLHSTSRKISKVSQSSINEQSSTPNNAPKRQRTNITDEEKGILNVLLLKITMPTEEEINNVLKKLSSAWDNQR